jgi:hypothetical protein
MAKSNATTVEAYLDELPEDRREVVEQVRDLVQRNLPKGYKETLSFGMITWCVPLERYPDTYNKQPLGYVALAAQKNYYALYLMNVYADSEQEQLLREEYAKAGKKLDIGKSCLRFKRLEDLQTDAVGKIIGSTTPEEFIERYEAARAKK